MEISYKGRKKSIKIKKLSFFGMVRGLMFRKKDYSKILYFKFNRKYGNSIHSYFVFFDFLAVWLDDKNKVSEIEVVKPFKFRIKPKRKIYNLIEIPINDKNRKIIGFFVGKRKV